MSSILYYSTYCQNSKELIQTLSRTKIKDDLHYFCIDKRVKKPNGMTYIVLGNGQEIILPPNITKVPALMLINNNHKVILGKDSILNHLKPQEQIVNQIATSFNGEPMAFSFNVGGFGVVSDNYSFLDQSPDALQAKGDGGLRQIHHYATLDHNDKINTPDDKYQPDKIGTGVSIEKLQQSRNAQLEKR